MAWEPEPGISLSDAFDDVMTKITHRDWNKFARSALRLDYNDIEEIKSDHPRNSKGQKYAMLEKWRENVGSNTSVEYLYAVLNYYLFPDECPSPVPPKKSAKSQRNKTQGDDVTAMAHSRPVTDAELETRNEPYDEIELAQYCSQVFHIYTLPCDPNFITRNMKMASNYKCIQGKGNVLIINNTFSHCKDSYREGSEVDVRNMQSLWQNLGCDVRVKTDLFASDMQSVLNNFSDACGEGYDYCVIFIMSHGDIENGNCTVILGNDGEKISVKEILDSYNNVRSPHLQGIPKLFFFQCCRGRGKDRGIVAGDMPDLSEMQPRDSPILPESRMILPGAGVGAERGKGEVKTDAGPSSTKLPTVSDMLVSYATQIGHQAYRNTANGSWFVNAIANVFMRHAKEDHVLDMMVKVNDAVAAKSASDDGAKSMSNCEFNLRKKLYFYPGYSD